MRILDTGLRATLAAILGACLLTIGGVAGAQETTSTLRGQITTPAGTPAANVDVRVTDTRTGSGRTLQTNSSGLFTADGLRVGGPYTVAVSSGQFSNQTVNDIFLTLGETYDLSLELRSAAMEELVVTASAVRTVETAVGPSSTFDLGDLQNAPAINRDIKDLIRIDPRIYVDEGFVDAIQCAGANPRFNSLTVDGVRLNDNFGLNSNGYPTERIPFSYDAIEQVAVELAPFDVQYGGFTACNINAVTKSGSNEFAGSVFYDYTDDSLSGDSLEDSIIDLGEFEEERYGLSIGGPIIRDRLFFFAAYEKLEGAAIFDRGPSGSGAGREIDGVSVADFEAIRDAAINIYGYDPGGTPPSLPEEDEKLLVKLDLNINDNHRASLTYNYNDGFTISEPDSDNDELEFSNHYYTRTSELSAYSAQLFSNWSDDFSTELKLGFIDLDNSQIPLAGTDFGEVQITTFNDPDGDGTDSRATVYLGADDSRHANSLAYESLSLKLAGTYNRGIHTFFGGYEREEFEAFNLFIQEAEGEYRFSSVQDFIDGTPNRITYENAAPSNNPNDAASTFEYAINTAYLQDKISFDDYGVQVIIGLRYDWYTSSDVPAANARFAERYGFSNQQNFDGEGLLQPRFGLTWDVSDRLSLRGGAGVYSGGNPNVWLSNNYSNNGITQVEVQDRTLDDGGPTLFDIDFNGSGRPIFDIPQNLFDAVGNPTEQADSGVNALDPNFEIPSDLKIAIGATWNFDAGFLGEDYTLNADYLYSKQNNAPIIRDATLERIGTAPDGRPIYRGIDRRDSACAVDPVNCEGRTQDFILTNVEGAEGSQNAFSVGISKSYDWGFDWSLGYAYTESSDVSPMTSSVAFSNFSNIAVSDPNNPGRAESNYEIPNRFTLRMSYQNAFFGDNMTKITVFGSANEGRPFTFTFNNGFAFGDSVGFEDRHLLYVPTGPGDPLVTFADPGVEQAFFDFVAAQGLDEFSGQILPRNAFHSDWWTKFDVKIEQEFPGGGDNKLAGFLVIENIGNLFNDEWGVLNESGFPRFQGVVDANINNGVYEYDNFFEPSPQGRVVDASLWEVRVGFRYDFAF